MSLVAAIQINSTDDIEQNLSQVEQQLAEASEQRAKLAVLPEMFVTLNSRQFSKVADDNKLLERIKSWARTNQLWLVAGAIPQPDPDGDTRSRSACLVIDDKGGLRARYDKIHLFDVDVGDSYGSYKESDSFSPGEDIVTVDTPVGRLGLAICYDLRFPRLFQQLRQAGAEIITLPSAFTYTTGEAHWQVLLRARAIEQQCYVIAANQCGWHDDKRRTYGHSQIVDPWGKVLAEIGEDAAVAVADIDLERLKKVRRDMPVFAHQCL